MAANSAHCKRKSARMIEELKRRLSIVVGNIRQRNRYSSSRMLVIQSQTDVDFFADAGPWITNSGHTPKETPMTKFKELLQNQIDAKNERIFVADTIETLAEKASIDKDTFTETVRRYNELVDKGVDEDFLKPAQYLTPLKEGPFYAFESNDAFYTTVGGVKINANVQVLDENDEIIPGLYAGGVDAGGLCGDTYDFQSAPGEQSSWAMNSGRLAAKHVAEYIRG